MKIYKKIYLSSGFFTDETKLKVLEVATVLRKLGCEVFVPMEHQIPNAWDISETQWAFEVFKQDVKAIDECDLMVVLDFGANGDCGTAWEAGYAYAKNIPYIVFTYGDDISLMVWNGAESCGGRKSKRIKLV